MTTKAISPGYRVSMISRFYASIINQVFDGTGITYGQIPITIAAVMEPGVTQDVISQTVALDKSTIARAITTLEKEGFIIRRENPLNRREKMVYPTEKLNKIVPDIHQGLQDVNLLLFDHFSDSEKTLMLQLLDKMIVNCKGRLGLN